MKKKKTSTKAKVFSTRLGKFSLDRTTLLAVVIIFAGIGSALILLTRAATPTSNIEPENKTVASPAITGNDSNASGGSYVQFKKAQQTTGKQKVIAWMSTSNMDALLGNTAGGITMKTLKDNNITGIAVSKGAPGDKPIPDWEIGEWQSARQFGTVNVGMNVGSIEARLPQTDAQIAPAIARWQNLANAAKQAGVNGLNMDGEPYGYPGGGDIEATNPWVTTTSAIMYSYGKQLGAIVKTVGDGTFIVYSSSNASWPGSYFDYYAVKGGRCPTTCYANNKFKDFLQGVIDGGAKVTYTDATFHQTSVNGDVVANVKESVRRTEATFPTMKSSIMFWPDNDESTPRKGGNWFTPSAVQTYVDAGTTYSTGTVVMYQHYLAAGNHVDLWLPWLAAVKAGSQ